MVVLYPQSTVMFSCTPFLHLWLYLEVDAASYSWSGAGVVVQMATRDAVTIRSGF